MLRFLPAVAVLALALVVAPMHAAAQGSPTMTISIVDLAPTATVNAGQAHTASFTVQVEASGFQCTSPASITIDVALSGAGAAPTGVTATVDPANITIAIAGPAVYGAPVPGLPVPVGEPLNTSGSATLRIATSFESSGTFPATVSAAYAGGQPEGCVGNLPAMSATANHQLTIVGANTGGNGTGPGTTPGPGTPGPGGNGTGNNTTAPPPPARGMPGFEPLALFGAAAAVVLLRRRD